MLRRVTAYQLRASERKWVVFAALGAQLAAFRALRLIGERFAEHTGGLETFDFQNQLTAGEIAAQLPAYTPDSKRWYRRFFIADLFFPLLASTFLGLLWAAMLRRSPLAWLRRHVLWHAPAWPYLATLFDWGENVCFLILIERFPRYTPGLARVAVVFKRLKLASLLALIPSTLLLLGVDAYGLLRSQLARTPAERL